VSIPLFEHLTDSILSITPKSSAAYLGVCAYIFDFLLALFRIERLRIAISCQKQVEEAPLHPVLKYRLNGTDFAFE